MKLIQVLEVLVFLIRFAVLQSKNDPCAPSEHAKIDDKRRLPIPNENLLEVLCDNRMVPGWYRFLMDGADAQIPTSCVTVNSCGTQAPIWLNLRNGKIPSVGQEGFYLGCIAWSFPGQSKAECCLFRNSIRVKNCGEFYVYYLQPTQGCHMAYCAEPKEKVLNSTSNSPTTASTFTSNMSLKPKLISLPRIQPIIVFDQVHLNCSFHVENADRFSLRWLKRANDETTRHRHVSDSVSEVRTVLKMKHMYDLLPFEDSLHLDDEVICEVKAFGNDHLNSTNTFSWNSTTFFAGLKVEPQHLSLKENDVPHTIRVTSTIPLICLEGYERQRCRMNLKLMAKAIDDEEPVVVLSNCDLEIEARECDTKAGCGFAEFRVAAIRDTIKRQSLTKRAIIDIRVNQDDTDLIWEGYIPKSVEVTVFDVPSAVCRSFTDPHIITLDGRYFDFYKSGTFVLYKSINRIFEVHNRIWFCGGIPKRVSCNCGFAVREDNQFVTLDMCNGNVMETEPDLRVKVLNDDDSKPLVKIMESRNGKVITVLFPSGSYIRANVEKWGMSLTLRAPSSDYNGSRGLCGTFDSNQTNDFHHKNGSSFDGGFQDASVFVETWRLPSQESFFDKDPLPLNVSREEQFCDCSDRAVDTAADLVKLELKKSCSLNKIISSVPMMMSSVDITDRVLRNSGILRIQSSAVRFVTRDTTSNISELNRSNILHTRMIDDDVDKQLRSKSREIRLFNNTENLTLSFKSKREVVETLPVISNISTNTTKYFFSGDFVSSDRIGNETLQWPTEQRNLDEEFVRKLCIETLLNSTIFVSCAEYLEKQVDAAIEICVTDVNLMDDPLWATYSLALLESFCQESVIDRKDLWLTNDVGLLVPPSNIVAALNCPNGCSGNGVCQEDGCECNPEFTSYDCSIFKEPKDQTIRLFDVLGGGLCDVATKKCSTVDVIGQGFLNSDDLLCRFVPLEMNGHRTLFATVTDVLGSDMNKVSCAAPIADLVLYNLTWEVRVFVNDSNIGKVPLFFTTYNSTCFVCESDTATKKPVCLIKDSVCFIRGQCFMENEMNPLNSCEFCLPFENGERWTTLAENATDLDTIEHPTLNAFEGQQFAYNIEILNFSGPITAMSLEKKFHDAVLWSNGTFTWTAFSNALESSQEKRIEKFTIFLMDKCNITRRMNVEIVVQHCLCQNGGVCIGDPLASLDSGHHRCLCPRFFTGANCELTIHACDSNPCYLGVRCFDDSTTESGFRCGSCPKHFYGNGTLCQMMDSQECSVNNSCFLGVECRKIANETFCGDCPNGYSGNGINCKPICKRPCRRNEVCTQPDVCSCLPGYDGLRCHVAICKPFCQNGGVCVRPNVCRCPSGFKGKHCEKVNCDVVCENGGRCNGRENCLCKPGFAGKRCEIVICNKKCYNGGSCLDHFGCDCAEGWGGPTCQVPLCDPVCKNGALCSKSGVCVCSRGFFGHSCESGLCRPPCLNGGQCVRYNMCSCQKGWVGNRCQIPICEPCCQNGGKCWKPNKCDCSSGWSGRYCQKPICVDKCENGGMCIAPHVCACQSGYKGPSCKEAICRPKCRNGGICASPGKCSCRRPFTGLDCGQINSRKLQEAIHKIRHTGHHLRRIWTLNSIS